MKQTRSKIENDWLKTFNSPLPKFIHKAYAIKYIKWHKENDNLDKFLQKQIDKLVENYEKGISTFAPSAPFKIEIKTGTKLIRDFKGTKYEVTKLELGYEFNGKTYKSLSAIANEITGTRWNGKKFFGLVK